MQNLHPRRYETLMLLDPDLPQETTTQIIDKLKGIIESMGGRLIREEDWGRRRLSYPVRKLMYGQYILFDFMGSPELLNELERNIRIDEHFSKYMTQLLDKKFSDEKYQMELDRISAEKARREAEKAKREADMQERGMAADDEDDDEGPGGFFDEDDSDIGGPYGDDDDDDDR
jgi:small subunit ribosomal protein S6